MAMVERIEVDTSSLVALLDALRAEADADKLRRELAENLAEVVEEAAGEARAAITSMPVHIIATPELRSAVAAGVQASVRLGRNPRGAVVADNAGMPRGFRNAPMRLNSTRGWRHQVFGYPDVWRTQFGKPGWFNDTISQHRPQAERAAKKVLDDMERRISARTREG